jgi:DNA-directed RNA polymerase specialized sigma24 family protein
MADDRDDFLQVLQGFLDAVRSLPLSERENEFLWLSFVEGMSLEEIAALTGLPARVWRSVNQRLMERLSGGASLQPLFVALFRLVLGLVVPPDTRGSEDLLGALPDLVCEGRVRLTEAIDELAPAHRLRCHEVTLALGGWTVADIAVERGVTEVEVRAALEEAARSLAAIALRRFGMMRVAIAN